jgi:hypothetical protein
MYLAVWANVPTTGIRTGAANKVEVHSFAFLSHSIRV